MISSYTSTSQTIDTDGLLLFSTNRILTGCTVTHTEGSSTFHLNRPGYYYVTFNGDASTTDTAGNIIIELFNNGSAIPGATATFYSATAADVGNLAFSTIVKVPPSCCVIDNDANLTIVNSGVEATYTNVNIGITKLC